MPCALLARGSYRPTLSGEHRLCTPVAAAPAKRRSRETRGFAYLIGLRPRDDGARSIDDGAVVEYEGGDLVIAGEALDLAASREQAVGAVTAVGPDDVRVVPGDGESSVGLGTGVAVGGSKRAVAHEQLHLLLLGSATPARISAGSSTNARSGTPRGSARLSSARPLPSALSASATWAAGTRGATPAAAAWSSTTR